MQIVDEHETTFTQPDGSDSDDPASKSYAVRGGLVQRMPLGLRARANVDYFSSIVTQQRYQQDLYRSTNRNRRFGGNVTGSWGAYVFSATTDRNDTFYGEDYQTSGNLPRVNLSRSERPIGRHAALLRRQRRVRHAAAQRDRERRQGPRSGADPLRRPAGPPDPVHASGRSSPRTRRRRGAAPTGRRASENSVQVPEPVGRHYFDFQTRITGPVFNRIWNRPGGGYAEKIKHVIEPTFSIQRVTAIDTVDQIVKLEGTDYELGNMTRYTYGLSNRLYAKKTNSREIVSATIAQSYYTDARSAQFDRQYQSSFNSQAPPTHFSPVALLVRSSPTEAMQAEFRTEWDATVHALRTLAASGTYNRSDWLSVSAGWSQRRYIPDLDGFNDPKRADHYLNASVNIRGARNRIGGQFAFNRDLLRDTFLQRRFIAYYNAQCCGIGFEYQSFNFQGSAVGFGVAAGSPLQHLVHARRNRHVLESLRRLRRAKQIVSGNRERSAGDESQRPRRTNR